MKKLPIGIQSIRELLMEDHVYVDKTAYAKDLIENGKHYFLCCPRRFGKSLFLDTLSEISKGDKELFKECKIYLSDYSWQKYPVIHFDFSRIAIRDSSELKGSLKRRLQNIARENELSVAGHTIQSGLESLIMGLGKKKNRVVILVDEYNKPIIDILSNRNIAEGNREVLRSFFTTLRKLEDYTRFTFITGVSTFSQASLFQALIT